MKRLAILLCVIAGLSAAIAGRIGHPVQAQLAAYSGFQYADISSNASTVAKSAAGTLHAITVNNAGTTWTLQVFDNTACSGTAIAGSTAVAVPAAGSNLLYDAQFNTGLCVKTAGTTAGDITVTWR